MGGYLSTKINPTLRLLIDNRLTESVASNEKEECYENLTIEFKNQGNWSELPSLPLEKIYSHASRNDQFNMSLVCRKWNEEFYSPSVWRKFKFNLSDSKLLKNTCPMMKFVQGHSCMFRHVEIEGTYVKKKNLMKNVCRHFTDFLQILTRNTQLTSLKFHGFSYCFWRIDTLTYNDMCREIIEFLASQCRLKRVKFDLNYFRYQESVQILRKLTENCSQTLTQVVLLFFVDIKHMSEEQKSNFVKNLPTLADFPSLKILEIDYSLIFENMVAPQFNNIQTTIRHRARVLSKIILHYNHTGIEHFRGLTSTDWLFLKKQYPYLQLEFIIYACSSSREEVEFLIVRNMPISRLEFFYETLIPDLEVSVLIDHLLACKTNDHLVTLYIYWEGPIANLSSIFIQFLQVFQKLKCLELFMFSPANGLDLLLKSLLENPHESLEKVIIDVSGIFDEDDYPSLMNLTTEYVSLLKLTGLNITVDLHF